MIAADYLAEVRNAASLPPEGADEIAIAGRSNVGKSTLLNRLAARRALARTSKTPGRTRGLVLYELAVVPPGPGPAPEPETGQREPLRLRLVDLPGYGYARVSQSERQSWQTLVESYVDKRRTLRLFIVLVDARRGLEDEERQLLEWLATTRVPSQLVFTKVDKLTASERGLLRERVRGTYATAPGNAHGGATRRPLFVSGETGEGAGELWRVILATLARGDAAIDAVAAGEQNSVT